MTTDDHSWPTAHTFGGQVATDHGMVPGCKMKTCPHAFIAHDVWDDEDPMPMCGAPGCRCRKPPVGWERTNQYFRRGDTIPAHVHVQALDGVVHQADAAWRNTDFEWLVEIEEIGTAR
ncbi:hypothetical protein BBK82_03125 [Lentzea guizhouensis]|uniref:Uncharacterized protein n=1 Tax=Lentzea guizhouensis TaxID=1586287 RepID=A0A1B2HBY0_9PSEU|nr:hypothetical protein [Lentzea guizhouensis]ANZ35209.1 hypothetical protein BBK82_03125 [Lentzea guizhouensis]